MNLSQSPRCLLGLILFPLLAATAGQGAARPASAPETRSAPVVHLTSAQAHQRMMSLLHIKTLRPGVSGQGVNRPDSANFKRVFDEAKANPYPNLPNPLVLSDGKKVTTAAAWWNTRRAQIAWAFNQDVYGWVPRHTPRVNWQVTRTVQGMNGKTPVITKYLLGHVDNSSDPLITVGIWMSVTTPAHAAGPVPVILEFGFSPEHLRQFLAMFAARGFKFPPRPPGPTWEQRVLAKGWGYAVLDPTAVQADNAAGLTEGIIGLCNKGQPRQPDQWGALRAWAWGASRALDYFETNKAVDAKEVGIMGHSRYGKAALVAMAYDRRFAIAYISSSGMGGAELYRRRFGERLENLAGVDEYHWMAGNFLMFAGPLGPNDLPVDSDELIAMCAPRPVFISAGATVGDGWVDARGEFMAAVAASPVYELLGKKGLGTMPFPPIATPLINGDLAYRQHHGGHTPAPNWPWFIKFASRYLKASQ